MWKDPKRKKEYQREYYLKNKEKIIKWNLGWRNKDYKENPQKYIERNKKYRLNHLKEYRKYRRDWNNQTPEGIWQVLKQGSKRRNKKLNISRNGFIKWWDQQEKVCFYCNVSVKNIQKLDDSMASWCKRLTIDRLDNKKAYQVNNMVLACRRCNAIKGDFFSWQEMKEIGEKYVKPKRIIK